MQLHVPYHRGQRKPWPSVPRINWNHPLAEGLLFYVYDAGGFYIDLVQNQLGKMQSGTTVASTGTYSLGAGIKWPGANNSGEIVFPVSNGAKALGATVPWSTACATYYLAGASGVFVAATGVSNTLGDTGPCFLTNIVNNSTMSMAPDNGNTIPNFTQTIASNTFQTWSASTNGTTSLNFYANGKLDSSPTVASTTFSIASESPYVVINNGVDGVTGGNSNGPGGLSGYLPYYAAWNRVLTATDNWTLHNDPWSLLIFPEDDMFATLVGASATTAALSGFTRAEFKALIQPTGKVPILGYGTFQTKALDQPSGVVPLSGKSEAQVKSSANTPSLKAAISALLEAQLKALASPTGKVNISARAEFMVKSKGLLTLQTVGQQALTALSVFMSKALAQPTGKVGISGTSESQVKATPRIQGSTSLSARTSALVKALANTPSLRAALSAILETQVKEQASPTGRLTLTALSTTQVKSNALATTTSNFLALVGTLTAQTKSALGNPPTIQILSSGRWISPEEVISSIARKYGRLGGLASANSRTAAQRSLLASIAAAHRWQK